MDITNKMLMDLAGQIGIDAGNRTSGNNIENMKKIAEQFKGKNDEELLSEIAKIKDAIKKDRATYEQQLRAVKALRPMMNSEQKARLDKIIELLED